MSSWESSKLKCGSAKAGLSYFPSAPPLAADIFRLFWPDAGVFAAGEPGQPRQRLPPASAPERILTPLLAPGARKEGRQLAGLWFLLLKLCLSPFFQVIIACERSGSHLMASTMSTAVS